MRCIDRISENKRDFSYFCAQNKAICNEVVMQVVDAHTQVWIYI